MLVLTLQYFGGRIGQYRDCWCPVSFYCQFINIHGIDNIWSYAQATPLYRYLQMADKKQKLSIEHEPMILNHAFVPLHEGLQLKLGLDIKLTDRNNYTCQLETQGRKICSDATEIKFEGKILGFEKCESSCQLYCDWWNRKFFWQTLGLYSLYSLSGKMSYCHISRNL